MVANNRDLSQYVLENSRHVFFLLKMWYMMRHVELTSETVSHFFKARKEKASTSLFRNYKCELIFASLYIFQTKILISQFFFHLVVINDTWKQQTTALEGLRTIICLMQTGILW